MTAALATAPATRRIKIAVFGAAKEQEEMTFSERTLARDLGDMLGTAFGDKIEILTGACIGVPDLVANNARRYGTSVVGYSGAQTVQEHIGNTNYASPDRLDEIRFTNSNDVVLNGLTERSLKMIRDADALVYLGGRTGTLTEYFAAFDGSNKPMYILQGSGGTIDRISRLKIKKQRVAGYVIETRSVFDLVSRLDTDFRISNFQNDPEIQIMDERTSHIHGCGWPQWLNYNPSKKTIIRR